MPVTPTTPATPVPVLTAWAQGEARATLGSIEAEVITRLGEFPGVPGENDPIGRMNAILDACDEVCRRTHCLNTDFVTNIVAGQATYCNVPSLIRAHALLVKDPQGLWWPVPVRQGPSAASLKVAASWWGDSFQSNYTWAAGMTGSGPITLYPTPETSVTGGLWISGVFAPGSVWEIDPTTYEPRPLEDSHTCPVPQYALAAVRELAILTRAKRLLVRRSDLAAQIPILTADAERLIGQAESTAATRNESLRKRLGLGAGYFWQGGYY